MTWSRRFNDRTSSTSQRADNSPRLFAGYLRPRVATALSEICASKKQAGNTKLHLV